MNESTASSSMEFRSSSSELDPRGNANHGTRMVNQLIEKKKKRQKNTMSCSRGPSVMAPSTAAVYDPLGPVLVLCSSSNQRRTNSYASACDDVQVTRMHYVRIRTLRTIM